MRAGFGLLLLMPLMYAYAVRQDACFIVGVILLAEGIYHDSSLVPGKSGKVRVNRWLSFDKNGHQNSNGNERQ